MCIIEANSGFAVVEPERRAASGQRLLMESGMVGFDSRPRRKLIGGSSTRVILNHSESTLTFVPDVAIPAVTTASQQPPSGTEPAWRLKGPRVPRFEIKALWG
ncbi:hypothetical protein EVAR_36569_1 [Eumeta japonica]|uniref:Uncharacterized protein n=1 Tax=Eumeta variegata TaxID=151549 RepID=A0A4C1Y2M3_EUMVA|nr:hypothetical protein EVAR_36569_1 [Eumeta japonica]